MALKLGKNGTKSINAEIERLETRIDEVEASIPEGGGSGETYTFSHVLTKDGTGTITVSPGAVMVPHVTAVSGDRSTVSIIPSTSMDGEEKDIVIQYAGAISTLLLGGSLGDKLNLNVFEITSTTPLTDTVSTFIINFPTGYLVNCNYVSINFPTASIGTITTNNFKSTVGGLEITLQGNIAKADLLTLVQKISEGCTGEDGILDIAMTLDTGESITTELDAYEAVLVGLGWTVNLNITNG